MEFIGFLIDVLIGRWIIRFIGGRVRYIFAKILREGVSFKTLKGEEGDLYSKWVNDLSNAIVGSISSLVIVTLIAYILFGMDEC